MPQLRFSATDKSIVLIGAIFKADDPSTPQTVLHPLRVIDGQSDAFTVASPGAYRYEFNIHGTAKFSLSLSIEPTGAPATCFAGPFDPKDPDLGASASIDRKSFFVV